MQSYFNIYKTILKLFFFLVELTRFFNKYFIFLFIYVNKMKKFTAHILF